MFLLKTDRLTLVGPDAISADTLYKYHHQNADHFAQGGGAIPDSPEECQQRLSAEQTLWNADRAYRIYGLSQEELILDTNLSNIIRGAFQAANLGYRTGKNQQGQGYMTEALEAIVAHAFKRWRLHRIMANYQPWNTASGHLLQKLGFEKEGFAKNYLYIQGAWRDHILTAKTNPDWSPPTG